MTKVSAKDSTKTAKNFSSQGNVSQRNKLRNDSARFREPAVVHKQDVPILSDSLLRRIDHARHLNNQNSQIQNLPLLPILKSYESRRVLSSSKSGRTNLGSARNLNSARGQPTQSKTVPKSTKISTFNGSISDSKNKDGQQQKEYTAQSIPMSYSSMNNYSNISHSLNIKPNTVMGLVNTDKQHEGNGIPNKNMIIDDMFQNGMYKFMDQNGQLHKGKPMFQSNQSLNSSQSQSNLLASLRNEGENSNMAEIIVRPTPINTKKYDEGITKAKHLNPNISLTPLIKNFRLNSFDFHGEFNVEKHMKNTQILKPLTDFKLKSNNKLSNKNYELAMLGCQTPKPTSKQSINYLAAGIINPKQTHNFNGSSLSSLNRKLDLDDFEYYDVQELFKKNAQLKSGLFRKKLSQINEESTVDGTPLSNSRWSSSLSNYSGKTVKYDNEDEVDIWSDIDEKTNLPTKSALSHKANDILLTAES